MNKERRKALDDLVVRLEVIVEELGALRDEESDYYDNMPEGLQASEKGVRAEEAANQLSEALEEIETAITLISEAKE
jgi:hypothetical protein